jgi:hypothetical protein
MLSLPPQYAGISSSICYITLLGQRLVVWILFVALFYIESKERNQSIRQFNLFMAFLLLAPTRSTELPLQSDPMVRNAK